MTFETSNALAILSHGRRAKAVNGGRITDGLLPNLVEEGS